MNKFSDDNMAVTVSAYTVVSAMNGFNEKDHFSGSCSSETLRPIFKKMAQLIMSATRHDTQILGSIGSKGECLRMREVVAVRRLFFLITFYRGTKEYTSRIVRGILLAKAFGMGIIL